MSSSGAQTNGSGTLNDNANKEQAEKMLLVSLGHFPVMALWQWGMAFSCHGLAVGHGVFLSWPGGSGAWRFPVMAWQWGHGIFLSWPGSGAWCFPVMAWQWGHGVFLS